MVSVFYFTPLPGFFSPFPHGTCSLSVNREYLALRDGPRRFQQDSSCPAVLRIHFRDYSISLTGLSPSLANLSRLFSYLVILLLHAKCPTTPVLRLVWAVTVSLATTKVIDFLSFPSGTKMFQFPELSSIELCIYSMILAFYCKCVSAFGDPRISAHYSSPRHFVVLHVLLRLLLPRHPPCALINLTTNIILI